ncbi:MAG TPA: molybdopterin converting factor subunit 1 [Bacteroidota bacterium]
MKIKLKLFSIAKDLAGFGEDTIEVADAAKADAVLEYLAQREPRFRPWRNSIRLAVNHDYVQGSYSLKDGDEVAVIPPVSGG